MPVLKNNRIQQIDSARGTAMLFVFLSHFGLTYFHENGATTWDVLFERIGMVATPTFMIISGIMLGYLYQTRKEKFGSIKVKMQNRGLFFLLIGHIIIAISHIPRSGNFLASFQFIFITDTIGFCIIFGPILIERMSSSLRVFIGICTYLLGWFGGFYWNPSGMPLEMAQSIFFGSVNYDTGYAHIYTFPLIPWFSVYILSSCIGEKFGKYQLEGDIEGSAFLLKRISLSLISIAVISSVVWKLAKWAKWLPSFIKPDFVGFSGFQKLPPGPVYIMFYGGLGFLIMYILLRLPDKSIWRKFIDVTSLLGQTSFFVFVLQYYVYFVVLYLAHLNYTIFWPLYLLATITCIIPLAYIWRIRGYNRFLTLDLVNRPFSSKNSKLV
jgi:uncharacterized membrane protein